MEKIRDGINGKLFKCEEIDKSVKYMRRIDNLLEAFKEFEESDGDAKLVIHSKSGHICETIITENDLKTFVNVLINEYNNTLESVKKEIDILLESVKKEIDILFEMEERIIL